MSDDEMYEAVLNCDPNYDGIFFYGVKSTGIFCRPSCRSKSPKRENVRYFSSAEEAEEAGFHPCKRCRSDLLSYRPMEEMAGSVKRRLEELYAKRSGWKADLQDLGLSERRMVDIFKETYGVTPKGYMDALRLEEAKRLLRKTDEKIIDIAALVGFGSLATFNRFFKKEEGMTPQTFRKASRRPKDIRADQAEPLCPPGGLGKCGGKLLLDKSRNVW